MKRTMILLSGILLLSSNLVMAQAIPNAGFEAWTAQGPFERPDDWIALPLVVKSTDMHSGAFAIQVEAGLFTNPQTQITDTVPGRAVTGVSGGGMGVQGVEGFAYYSRPDSLTGWYKYVPNGVDECIIRVTLTEWNSGTSSKDTIATGTFFNSSNPNYERFSLPLNYVSVNNPDTCVIELMSSLPISNILGSILTVDDLAFVSATSALSENDMNEIVTIFPNPSSDIITVQGLESATIVIYNTIGNEVMKLENSTVADLTNFEKGTYIVKINTADGVISKTIVKM